MISLPKPGVSVGEVVDAFARGTRINSVHAHRQTLVGAETHYDGLAPVQRLYSMPARPTAMTKAEADDVSWAYETHFRHRKGGGRPIYSALRASTKSCPICRARDVAALDHHLPRESYPALAIQPSNLVPICSVCNYVKSRTIAIDPADQFLHPYFDELGDGAWLVAEVIEEPTGPVTFSVAPLPAWDPVLTARVEKHFDRFGLSRFYADRAGTAIGGQRRVLDRVLASAGPTGVSDHLFEQSDSVADFGAEPWLAAAYAAWGSSEWFCNGGWSP